MILPGDGIRKAVEDGEIFITNFEKHKEESLQPATNDLRVGEQGFKSARKVFINL